MTSWHLRKWYLDCVSEDGTVWIGYAGELGWGAVALSFASSLIFDGARSRSRTTLRRCEEPRIADGRLLWSCAPLAVDAEAAKLASVSTAAELYPGVRWHCLAPAADVRVNAGDRTITGRGYAELLELSVPPWDLPIHELRWGRMIGESTSLAWIQWSGAHPLNLVYRNGVLETCDAINDEEIRLADGTRLAISEPSSIRNDRLSRTLSPLKPIVSLLPKMFTRTVERKWRSRGKAFSHGRPDDEGWVIHELITFAPG